MLDGRPFTLAVWSLDPVDFLGEGTYRFRRLDARDVGWFAELFVSPRSARFDRSGLQLGDRRIDWQAVDRLELGRVEEPGRPGSNAPCLAFRVDDRWQALELADLEEAEAALPLILQLDALALGGSDDIPEALRRLRE